MFLHFMDIASNCETSIARAVCLPHFTDIASNCETSIARAECSRTLWTLRQNVRQVKLEQYVPALYGHCIKL